MTTDYQNATVSCGTLTTTPTISNAWISYFPANTTTTGYYVWPYSYPYNTTVSDSRVAALEAEVKVLREMLAAVLSGRDLPKPARKRRA